MTTPQKVTALYSVAKLRTTFYPFTHIHHLSYLKKKVQWIIIKMKINMTTSLLKQK